MVGGEEDACVSDLWFVEEPPAPSIGKGIFVIELDLHAGGINAELTGFEGAV